MPNGRKLSRPAPLDEAEREKLIHAGHAQSTQHEAMQKDGIKPGSGSDKPKNGKTKKIKPAA